MDERNCRFILWDSVAGKKLNKTQMEKLIKNKRSGLIQGFKSRRKAVVFNAYLVMDSNGRIRMEFEHFNHQSKVA